MEHAVEAHGEVAAVGGSPPDSTGHGPPSLVERVAGTYRAAMKFLGRRALARATLAVPRTLKFMVTTALSGEVSDAVPAPSLTWGLAGGVAMDEALLAMAMAPSRFPRRADFARVSAELADARRMFSRRGWIARPLSYHRTPPPLSEPDVEMTRGWALGQRYERITYDSGFSTRAGEPGGEQWMAYAPNSRATATIVRHRGDPRPWIVCVHGFCMGYPFMDFMGLHTTKLHRELGLNVAMPVLPLHGPRKVTLVSGEPFLGFDMMNTVHGLAQAVWDIRRLVSWIRAQGATSIGLYGVSLGAYVVSLLAGIDEGFDAVVAGIPVVDFPALFHEHSPVHIRARSIEHRIMGGVAELSRGAFPDTESAGGPPANAGRQRHGRVNDDAAGTNGRLDLLEQAAVPFERDGEHQQVGGGTGGAVFFACNPGLAADCSLDSGRGFAGAGRVP